MANPFPWLINVYFRHEPTKTDRPRYLLPKTWYPKITEHVCSSTTSPKRFLNWFPYQTIATYLYNIWTLAKLFTPLRNTISIMMRSDVIYSIQWQNSISLKLKLNYLREPYWKPITSTTSYLILESSLSYLCNFGCSMCHVVSFDVLHVSYNNLYF